VCDFVVLFLLYIRYTLSAFGVYLSSFYFQFGTFPCHTVVSDLPKVGLPASGTTYSHGLTGGVYKARERIHRDMLIRDY